ncbi:MAG: ATP-binding protein [Candidatus Cyclobacteriaceae bacterium M3_2C_046]
MNYKFEVPCSKDQLKAIRNFVNNVLQGYSFSELEVNSMVLAVEEVCANLMIHSHNCNPSEMIKLSISVDQNEGITFNIMDHGLGFDFKNYKEPAIQDIIKQKKKGGLGLMLVRRIMDDIEYKKGTDHNIYKLFKRCKACKA